MSNVRFAPSDPNEWVPRVRSALRRIMCAWGSSHEVDDLVAEGVAAAFSANREAGGALPLPLLITIGNRRAVDYLRRMKRPKRGTRNTSNDPLTYAVQLQESFVCEAVTVDGALSHVDVCRCLDSISATLDGRDRLIFDRLRAGVAQKDIAAELGVSRARASQLVQRLMEHLREGHADGESR